MGGGLVHLTGDALPRGTYFWQAVHGRLTSGMTAMDGGNACERQDAGVVLVFEMWIENIVLQNFLE